MDGLCKALLAGLIKGAPQGETLWSALLEKDRQALQTIKVPPIQEDMAVFTHASVVHQVHYSWIIPFCEPFAEQDKLAIFSSLSSDQQAKLAAHFHCQVPTKPSSPLANAFVLKQLYDYLTQSKTVWPVRLLPEDPLNSLLDFSKAQRVSLVDWLSLYDLAPELAIMIESGKLKTILQLIPKIQMPFLYSLMRAKNAPSLTFSKLHLDRWEGDVATLKKALHQRGINRLAKALVASHPSLTWLVQRRLDTGRANLLQRCCTSMNNEAAQKIVVSQVLTLIPKVESS